MSTVALAIFTGAYPAITAHDITVNIYDNSNPMAIIASATHPAPHLADTWNFAGLPRVNLIFRVFETNGGAIVQQLGGDEYVVPGTSSGVSKRATEQIQADVTVGMTSGVNSFTFDGTSGTEDWRGNDIDTIDRMGGEGAMKRGVEYSWNTVTGKFMLLLTGDVFGTNEWFNVQFAMQIVDTTLSVPASIPLFSTPKIITANYTADAGSDFGGLLIVDPASTYSELTLPTITTVVPGRLLTVEMRRASVNKCCKIISTGGALFDWLAGGLGSLYICPQESLSIYRFTDPAGPTDEWRVIWPSGNFTRIGEDVVDDNIAANVFNKIMMDGSQGDVQALARFYNTWVLNLPGAQVVNYDSWTTGNNKYFFSLANSSNPANAGKFMIADRRNTFERTTDGTRLPGAFQAQAMADHRHEETIGTLPVSLFGKSVIGRTSGQYRSETAGNFGDFTGPMIDSTGAAIATGEVRPANIAIRKWKLV